MNLKELLESKKYVHEQLLALRKHKDNKEVNDFINYLAKDCSKYFKYLLDKYYYKKPNLKKIKKKGLEKHFQVYITYKDIYIPESVKLQEEYDLLCKIKKENEKIEVDKNSEFYEFDCEVRKVFDERIKELIEKGVNNENKNS